MPGEGPTFVEAVTYRSAPHATADDPGLYIDADRVAAEEERDCVAGYEGYLRRLGLLDDAAVERSGRTRSRRCARRSRRPRARRRPTAELVFAHAYADPPAALARDLDELGGCTA